MNPKRKLSQLEKVPHPQVSKKSLCFNPLLKSQIQFYQAKTTSFLRPNTDLIINFDGIFRLRSFRLIQGFHALNLPVFDELEILVLLEELFERYKEPSDSSNIENILQQKPQKISKKEVALLEAKDYLLERNLTYKQIAEFTGLKVTQIKSLQKRLSTTGEILPFKKKRPSKLNETHRNFIIALLTEKNGCILTLAEIKTQLLRHFPLIENISLQTISNTLKKEKFSFKKISPYINLRVNDQYKIKQKKVSEKLITILSQEYKIIFVDETGIKLNCHPSYGWGKKGEKVSLEVHKSKKNFSIIAAITDQEVLGCQILEKGGVKKEDFLGFLCTVINQCFIPEDFHEIIVFLDNATSHTTPYVTANLASQVTFIFNASYTPMLNPIEEFFSKFKSLIKKELIENSFQLIHAVQKALTSFSRSDFRGYIRHVLKNAEVALQGENLY